MFDSHKAETDPLLEAHSRDVTSDGCILLVAAAQRLLVEETLCDGFLKSWALHLVHVHRAHAWKEHTHKRLFWKCGFGFLSFFLWFPTETEKGNRWHQHLIDVCVVSDSSDTDTGFTSPLGKQFFQLCLVYLHLDLNVIYMILSQYSSWYQWL